VPVQSTLSALITVEMAVASVLPGMSTSGIPIPAGLFRNQRINVIMMSSVMPEDGGCFPGAPSIPHFASVMIMLGGTQS